MTLEEAPIAKLDRHLPQARTCSPDDHLLEIGTGWGGFALHAAGVTAAASRPRRSRAAARAGAGARRGGGPRRPHHAAARGLPRPRRKLRQAGLDRDDRGDRPPALRRHSSAMCSAPRARRPDAAAGDHHRRPALRPRARSVDFIKRHIFPGCCIPSVSALARAMAAFERPAHRPPRGHRPALRDHAGALAQQLPRQPRDGFRHGLPRAVQRMWEFYLCYCEAGFAERALGDVQVLLARD